MVLIHHNFLKLLHAHVNQLKLDVYQTSENLILNIMKCLHPLCFLILRDVLPQNFDSYSTEVQKLICTADHLGSLMQYDTPGFLPNKRIHRGTGESVLKPQTKHQKSDKIRSVSLRFVFKAMGLATLEVMQAMHRTWSSSKVRVNGKTRQMQWRDMFDIAVKWRRSEKKPHSPHRSV